MSNWTSKKKEELLVNSAVSGVKVYLAPNVYPFEKSTRSFRWHVNDESKRQKEIADAAYNILGITEPIANLYTPKGKLIDYDNVKDNDVIVVATGKLAGKNVYLVTNEVDYQKTKVRFTWYGKRKEIQNEVQKQFKIQKPIGKLFSLNGDEIKYENLKNYDVVVVAFGDDKFVGKNVFKNLKFNAEDEKEKDKNERILEQAQIVHDERYRRSELLESPLEDKVNYFIAMSKTSIAETSALASLSLFANMSETEQQKLGEKQVENFQKEISALQEQFFYKQLIEQGICTSSSTVLFEKEMTLWSLQILEKLNYDQVKFVIYGKRFSGKTTLLNNLAVTFYRKLSLSGLTSHFLPIPLNFNIHHAILENEIQAYDLILHIVFASLKYSCPQILPVYDFLFNWFKGLTQTLSIKQLTPLVDTIKGVNPSKIQEIGRSLVNAFTFHESTKASRSLTKSSMIYSTIAQFPFEMAKAFGFEGPIFILDHIDSCPEELMSHLSPILEKSIFICASQIDNKAYSSYTLKSSTPLFTDKILDITDERKLLLADRGIYISTATCDGCPGFLAKFLNLIDFVNSYQQINTSKFNRITLAADKSKQILLHKKVLAFLELIEYPEGITKSELLDYYMVSTKPIPIKVVIQNELSKASSPKSQKSTSPKQEKSPSPKQEKSPSPKQVKSPQQAPSQKSSANNSPNKKKNSIQFSSDDDDHNSKANSPPIKRNKILFSSDDDNDDVDNDSDDSDMNDSNGSDFDDTESES